MLQLQAAELRRLIGAAPLRSPAYRDLAERIRLLVVDGQLGGGLRLPSERDLGAELSLSRTTVAATYSLLRDLGVSRARRGAGNFVRPLADPPASIALSTPALPDESGTIPLNAACTPAPPGIAVAYQRAADQLPRLLAGTGYYPDGLPQLRQSLADWFTGRGVRTDPGQIVVTGGALAAFNVVVRALGGPHVPVLVEVPTYHNALSVLAAMRARVIGLPTSADGWDPELLDQLLTRHQPRLAFLITEFQNPTGSWVTDERRERAAAALRRHQVVGVIDETLLELRLDGDPPRRPMASFPGPVITIGSASKAFWGGLRLGWLRAPRSMINSLVAAQASLDMGTAPLEQAVLAELLEAPEPILARQRELHRERRDRLVAELAGHFPEWRATVPRGGQSLWYDLGAPSAELLVAAAREHGLIMTAGTRFYPPGSARSGGARRIRIPFVADPDHLAETTRRLAAAWEFVQSSPATRRPSAPVDLMV